MYGRALQQAIRRPISIRPRQPRRTYIETNRAACICVFLYIGIFVYVFLHISVTVYYCICVLVGGLLGPGGGHTSRPGEPHVDVVWLSLIRIYALYCLAYMPAVVRKHICQVYLSSSRYKRNQR